MARNSLKPITLRDWAWTGVFFYQDFAKWLTQLEREYPEGRPIPSNTPAAMSLESVLDLIDDARPRIVEKLKQVKQQENDE